MAISLSDDAAKKVLRQVEFYFSDSNLPRDNFLKKSISESEDGMVSLALICSFSRMRTHLNLGSIKADDVPEDTVKSVAETLRKSTFLKISEDGKKVGRVTELPKEEEVIEQLDIKTLAASPLPCDVKLEDVESFFGQYGTVNRVRLPRHVADNKLFCGTALIEFSTEEDAEKILKQNMVYAGANLDLIPKKEFDAERLNMAEKFESYRASTNRKNNSNAEAYYPKGLIISFTLKSMKTGGSNADGGSHDPKTDGVDQCTTDKELDSTENSNINENHEENVEERAEKVNEKNGLESGGVETEEEKDDAKNGSESGGIETEEEKSSENPPKKEVKEEKPSAASYINNMDVVMREDLKSVFKKFGPVMFIDFKIGEESGYVRFDEPEAAQKARAAAVLAKEGGLIVKNFVATLEPVTGEAEREYWSLLRGNQEKHRDSKGNNRGRGGKFNRGGRHGKHSRSRENYSDSGRPNKAQKVA